MTKVKCITLSQTLPSNEYETRKNNRYTFFLNCWTEISDKDDVEFFRKAGGGKAFVVDGIVNKIESVISNIIPPKKEIKKYTEKELLAMNKEDQTKIIKQLGGTTIPAKEKERVQLILKLQ